MGCRLLGSPPRKFVIRRFFSFLILDFLYSGFAYRIRWLLTSTRGVGMHKMVVQGSAFLFFFRSWFVIWRFFSGRSCKLYALHSLCPYLWKYYAKHGIAWKKFASGVVENFFAFRERSGLLENRGTGRLVLWELVSEKLWPWALGWAGDTNVMMIFEVGSLEVCSVSFRSGSTVSRRLWSQWPLD